ncbi:MAG: redox-regulated ATPase YchF [bacterium]
MANPSAGIIGLPNVGKSTLFNALTQAGAQVAKFPFSTVSPNVGMALVPDPRLESLAELINPEVATPASVEFTDVAGLVRGAHRGEGLGNEFLSRIRSVDLLVEILRCFEGKGIAHSEGSIDPIRDAEIIELELLLSDLKVVERRLTKLGKLVRSGVKGSQERVGLLQKVKTNLEKGNFLGKICTEKEKEELVEEGLLTLKPLLYVANIDENDLTSPSFSLKSLREYASQKGLGLIEMCAQLEAELAEVSAQEKAEFLKELKIEEELNKLIREVYRQLNLITFFTISGGREVRAWSVKERTTAPQAAGRVHSDMQKGFVRAEVVSVSDLLELGSMKRAKEEGRVKIEGKDYLVEDGDVIHFRFTR